MKNVHVRNCYSEYENFQSQFLQSKTHVKRATQLWLISAKNPSTSGDAGRFNMEYIKEEQVENNAGKILCCQCGVVIEPNPANMCVACLRTVVDITEGIPKQGTLHFCKGCERYLQPPNDYVHAALESRELLSLCLKKLKGLSRVKLIDAGFVWTEPHSKRIKVKLTVHGEVMGGTVLQQVFIVEFTVAHQMCDDCHRKEAQDYWHAMVQVRQKAENKKTFHYLEQLILKHKAHENTLGIKPIAEGLDFYYHTQSHARKMVDFLTTVLPIRYEHSKKLISHDIHSNTYNYKFSYSVEIVPLSKDSLVCLPKNLTHQLGSVSPLVLVHRVTNTLHFIDPATAQMAEMNSNLFWRYPFKTICNPKQLSEYIVMELEIILAKDRKTFPGQGPISTKHVLADAWLVKASELGINEDLIHTRTHLGHLLKPGDSVMAYCLADSNVNDSNFDKLDRDKIPDVIIVKKHYGDRSGKRRRWKLKHLTDEGMLVENNKDYNEFLDDLEEDAELRQNVNIFKDPNNINIPVDADEVDPNAPHITLEEMLDDLQIEDDPMEGDEGNEGEQGDGMAS
ncbi:60S ribosomal export protein NMD3 [Frankliniella occidentalis]|uniref:60S ribosomal export protein NMD3 n=1 Tax=Frankliniella occidentalis TaxID=133901 RepID=A0A6J1S5M4_FRAOC|nr:60S ribosomal export protein NMD3 [Frankliniella occidentalis]